MIYNAKGDLRGAGNDWFYGEYGFYPKLKNEGGSIVFPVRDITSGPTGTRLQLVDIINGTDIRGNASVRAPHEAHRCFMENRCPKWDPSLILARTLAKTPPSSKLYKGI